MHESPLTPWATFYVIIGSAAAVLTGLMFVGITVITGTRAHRPAEGIAAFSSPSIVHFSTALAISAILNAPWHVLWHAGLLLTVCGLGGVAYSVVVVRRVLRQAVYQPVVEDWSWHVVLPLASYVALVLAAIVLPGDPEHMLFIVGAATLLLLFIGIHNAWDNATYIIIDHMRPTDDDIPPSETSDEGQASAFEEGEGAPTAMVSIAGIPHEVGTSGAGDSPRDVSSEGPG